MLLLLLLVPLQLLLQGCCAGVQPLLVGLHTQARKCPQQAGDVPAAAAASSQLLLQLAKSTQQPRARWQLLPARSSSQQLHQQLPRHATACTLVKAELLLRLLQHQRPQRRLLILLQQLLRTARPLLLPLLGLPLLLLPLREGAAAAACCHGLLCGAVQQLLELCTGRLAGRDLGPAVHTHG
jgi:hypothetical protein